MCRGAQQVEVPSQCYVLGAAVVAVVVVAEEDRWQRIYVYVCALSSLLSHARAPRVCISVPPCCPPALYTQLTLQCKAFSGIIRWQG